VFPAASASGRVGTTGRGFCGVTTPKTPAHRGDESPELVAVDKAPGYVAVGQAPEIVAVGYDRASPGLAQVAPLADHLPWYLHHQPR